MHMLLIYSLCYKSLVLVSLGNYTKVPDTEWLINTRNLLLRVLEAVNLTSGNSMVRFWWGPSFRLQISRWEQIWRALWVSCYKGTNPIHDLITSQRPPPPNTITLRVSISTYEWGGRVGKYSVHGITFCFILFYSDLFFKLYPCC